jgi:hypothetical protein
VLWRKTMAVDFYGPAVATAGVGKGYRNVTQMTKASRTRQKSISRRPPAADLADVARLTLLHSVSEMP